MIESSSLLAFILLAIGMVLTPGPNMIYLVSRTICQGRLAGFISLGGVVVGFIFYMVCAALGITTLALAVPLAYDILRYAGAAYLLYLAWQTLKPGGRSAFEVRNLKRDSARRLFSMGLFTSLLNPKVAVLYVSLLPQFIRPEEGSVLLQSLVYGTCQIIVSFMGNTFFIFTAGTIAAFLAGKPFWIRVQRWLMGTVLGLLALKVATDPQR